MTSPHWTTVLAALLVPTIAIFGAYIAYRQWQTAQNQIKLNLFDRRLAVYEAVRQVITTGTSGRISQEAEFQYLSSTRGALWLYNEDIVRYLDEEIWHKVVDLGTLQSELEGLPVGEERTKNIQGQRDIKKWLVDQRQIMDRKFAPFLTLGH